VLSRCFTLSKHAFLQLTGIFEPGSIPGSSTKKLLVRASSFGQFSFHQHLINIRINKSTDLAVAKSHQRHSRSAAPPFELRSSACESAHATT